jgi:hypothetical protein
MPRGDSTLHRKQKEETDQIIIRELEEGGPQTFDQLFGRVKRIQRASWKQYRKSQKWSTATLSKHLSSLKEEGRVMRRKGNKIGDKIYPPTFWYTNLPNLSLPPDVTSGGRLYRAPKASGQTMKQYQKHLIGYVKVIEEELLKHQNLENRGKKISKKSFERLLRPGRCVSYYYVPFQAGLPPYFAAEDSRALWVKYMLKLSKSYAETS